MAAYDLALRYRDGRDVEQNKERFLFWLRKSKAPEALAVRGQLLLAGDGVAQDRAKGYAFLAGARELALWNHPPKELVAPFYDQKALDALLQSMSSDERKNAEIRFAAWKEDSFIRALPCPPSIDDLDPAARAELIRRAEAGDADAQYWLGDVYERERHDRKTRPEWREKSSLWWHKAAAQGYAKAQWSLAAWLGEEGAELGDPLYWRRAAAEQGLAVAQFDLGQRYEKGDGVPRDMTQALAWYRKAAENFSSKAALRLGQLYLARDEGVFDPAQAVIWLNEAADDREADSFALLAECFRTGQGVEKDTETALMWLLMAKRFTYGSDEEEKIDRQIEELSVTLTPAQQERAAARMKEL